LDAGAAVEGAGDMAGGWIPPAKNANDAAFPRTGAFNSLLAGQVMGSTLVS